MTLDVTEKLHRSVLRRKTILVCRGAVVHSKLFMNVSVEPVNFLNLDERPDFRLHFLNQGRLGLPKCDLIQYVNSKWDSLDESKNL